MQRTRRLIEDTQYIPPKRTVAQWPLTMLHISAVVLTIQIAAWFILAWNGNPYHRIVLASGAQVVVAWFVVMMWSIKEMR
ncbi:hypothetical protein KC953_03915 [Candidatus Saccharibacteria bacterium]|nr:hypothetical protein [Candidatus Saccharibacteria bacterium]